MRPAPPITAKKKTEAKTAPKPVAEIKERREPGDEPAVKTDAEKLGEMKSKLGIEKALYHGIEVEVRERMKLFSLIRIKGVNFIVWLPTKNQFPLPRPVLSDSL